MNNQSLKIEKHKVSIVIPCYNAQNTLATTLKSVQNYLHKNLDVLIVEDGSENPSEQLVASFQDDRFRYVYKNNEGPGLARNYGIDNALGEYIFFLDSDDEIYPDSITNLLKFALENDLDVVSGVTVRKNFTTGVEGEWFRNLYKTKSINSKKQRLDLFNDTLTTNKIYRVEMLKNQNIYFEEGLYEDKLFTAKLYSKLDKIGLIDDRVYIWWVYGSDTSITTKKDLANFKERQVSIDKLWEYIPELRKSYQISFYMSHDLLIYLREFCFYDTAYKEEIYQIAKDFIQKNKKYIYYRFTSASLNRACLDALVAGDREKFIYTADILSILYQDELKAKAKV